eukprot:3244208-Amphidinium_carterae.1
MMTIKVQDNVGSRPNITADFCVLGNSLRVLLGTCQNEACGETKQLSKCLVQRRFAAGDVESGRRPAILASLAWLLTPPEAECYLNLSAESNPASPGRAAPNKEEHQRRQTKLRWSVRWMQRKQKPGGNRGCELSQRVRIKLGITLSQAIIKSLRVTT